MRRPFLFIITLLVITTSLTPKAVARPSAAAKSAVSNSLIDSLLRQLDLTISQKDIYTARRDSAITAARTDLRTITLPEDRYNILRTLYSQYRAYLGDSARWVAERRMEIARSLDDPKKIVSSSLNLAESYSQAGDYYRALRILDSIPRQHTADYHLNYLYNLYSKTYARMAAADAIQSNAIAYRRLQNLYTDSTLRFTTDPIRQSFLQAERLLAAGRPNEAIGIIQKWTAANRDKQLSSQNLLIAAEAYARIGDTNAETAALTRAAILDIENGLRDYSALPRLATLLNQTGDTERAYKYIRCALNDARLCNAKSRTSEILELIPLIDAGYHQAEERRMHTLIVSLGIIILLAIALALAIRIITLRVRQSRKISRSLQEANENLADTVKQLAATNTRLAESNEQRIRYISEVFDAHSGYIARMENFRSRLRSLLASSQTAKARHLLDSSELESAELKELYSRFDNIFLSLYPNFISDFNAICRPEFRINPEAKSLSSEMRVLALINIGITSTNAIAEMLHYSPQTVYNYKTTLRTALGMTREEFKEYLQKPK